MFQSSSCSSSHGKTSKLTKLKRSRNCCQYDGQGTSTMNDRFVAICMKPRRARVLNDMRSSAARTENDLELVHEGRFHARIQRARPGGLVLVVLDIIFVFLVPLDFVALQLLLLLDQRAVRVQHQRIAAQTS